MSGTAGERLGKKPVLPRNTANKPVRPQGERSGLKEATPLISDVVPRDVAPSKNSTCPDATPLVAATLAVSVTGWPKTPGLGETPSVVIVGMPDRIGADNRASNGAVTWLQRTANATCPASLIASSPMDTAVTVPQPGRTSPALITVSVAGFGPMKSPWGPTRAAPKTRRDSHC